MLVVVLGCPTHSIHYFLTPVAGLPRTSNKRNAARLDWQRYVRFHMLQGRCQAAEYKSTMARIACSRIISGASFCSY